MPDTSATPSTVRDDAARDLAHALDEAYWARLRYQKRTSPIGYHGENYDARAARDHHVVMKFNERAVKKARKNALRAGWTREQLESSGLNGAERDPGSARA